MVTAKEGNKAGIEYYFIASEVEEEYNYTQNIMRFVLWLTTVEALSMTIL